MSDQACKTPVEDLLRAIPRDHVIQFETDDNGFKVWHNCPIGREAHEAAEKIIKLQAEVERLTGCLKNADATANELVGKNYGLCNEIDRFRALIPATAAAPVDGPKCENCDRDKKVHTSFSSGLVDCPDCTPVGETKPQPTFIDKALTGFHHCNHLGASVTGSKQLCQYCAPARAEQPVTKCVCRYQGARPICGRAYSDVDSPRAWCANPIGDGESCGHPRACHALAKPTDSTGDKV